MEQKAKGRNVLLLRYQWSNTNAYCFALKICKYFDILSLHNKIFCIVYWGIFWNDPYFDAFLKLNIRYAILWDLLTNNIGQNVVFHALLKSAKKTLMISWQNRVLTSYLLLLPSQDLFGNLQITLTIMCEEWFVFFSLSFSLTFSLSLSLLQDVAPCRTAAALQRQTCQHARAFVPLLHGVLCSSKQWQTARVDSDARLHAAHCASRCGYGGREGGRAREHFYKDKVIVEIWGKGGGRTFSKICLKN